MSTKKVLYISIAAIVIVFFSSLIGLQVSRQNKVAEPDVRSAPTSAQTNASAVPASEALPAPSKATISIVAAPSRAPANPSRPSSKAPAQAPAVSSSTPVQTPAKTPSKAPAVTTSNTPTVTTSNTPAVTTSDAPAVTKSQFQNQYALAQRQYQSELQSSITAYKNQLRPLNEKIDTLYANYLYQQRQLKEKFANMGLLNSGIYKDALSQLDRTYNNQRRALTEQTEPLQNAIRSLEQELQDPDVNEILAIVAVNYGYSAAEVVAYYDRFILE